jgi:hypothetical protein
MSLGLTLGGKRECGCMKYNCVEALNILCCAQEPRNVSGLVTILYISLVLDKKSSN